MRISRALHDELVAIAQSDAPLETCGLVASEDGQLVRVYPCVNAAASEVRYEIDGLDQMVSLADMAARKLQLGATYHSHTHAEAYPSQMDVATAFWPEALYIIVGLQDRDWPEVRAFRIVDGQVTEEPLEVITQG